MKKPASLNLSVMEEFISSVRGLTWRFNSQLPLTAQRSVFTHQMCAGCCIPGHTGLQSNVVSHRDQFISLWTSLQVDKQPMLKPNEKRGNNEVGSKLEHYKNALKQNISIPYQYIRLFSWQRQCFCTGSILSEANRDSFIAFLSK